MKNALLVATGTAQALCMATDDRSMQTELIDTEAGGTERPPLRLVHDDETCAGERGEHCNRDERECYPLSGWRHGSSLLAGRREGGENGGGGGAPSSATQRSERAPIGAPA